MGKAFGMANGTRDMNVENYGKLILQESDTTVGMFNPFGFREDYGGQDMIPMEYQVGVRDKWPKSTIMLAGGLTPNQGLSVTLDRLTHVRGEIQGLRPQALHLRLDQEKGLVVRRREARLPDVGKVPQAGHQEHRLPQGHPVRPVLRALCARGGFRRRGGRFPRPELHRLSLRMAVSRRTGAR